MDVWLGQVLLKRDLSEFINNKTKEQLAIMCDEELLAEILAS